jgi:heptosyltransferase-1
VTLSEVFALRRVLQGEEFDVCVDMQGALKSAVVGNMASATVLAGFDRPRERVARWFYRQRVATASRHVVDQGCELLGAAVGESLRAARVTLPMDAEDERWANGLVGGERFCLISPGAGWGAKIWPAERYGAVAAALGRAGVTTLVNTSIGEFGEADRVAEASEGYARAAKCSVGQLIALVRRAAVVIAGDTGPLHLAAALERPLVGIYGPTDPARNGPYGAGRARVLRDAESVTSHKRVGQAEAGMLRIGVDEVVQAAMEMLG